MMYLFSICYLNCDINCWKLQNISVHLRLHKKKLTVGKQSKAKNIVLQCTSNTERVYCLYPPKKYYPPCTCKCYLAVLNCKILVSFAL